MQWADVIARDLLKRGNKHLINTGISPSGFIHVGSLEGGHHRQRGLQGAGGQGGRRRLIYLVDDYDPLRKRYPFLPSATTRRSASPCARYPAQGMVVTNPMAHHFIHPFLDAIARDGHRPDVYYTHELYEQGKFAEITDLVIREKDKVAQILSEVTGERCPRTSGRSAPSAQNAAFSPTRSPDTSTRTSTSVRMRSRGQGGHPQGRGQAALAHRVGRQVEDHGRDLRTVRQGPCRRWRFI